MDKNQRQAAFNLALVAVSKYATFEVELDANVKNNEGFDEVEDGVWVHAWIKVPASSIPGYEMTPPAPAAKLSVVTPASWPFPTMRHPHLNTDSSE